MLAVFLLAGTLTGCGGKNKPAVCNDIDSLKSSMTDLKNINIDKTTLTTLQNDVNKIRSQLSKTKTDAKAQFSSEISAVDQAASALNASVKAAVATPSAATIAVVGTSLQAFASSLSALEKAVTSTC